MRIVHATARRSPEQVDGASNSVWVLARGQAGLGHAVTVVAHQDVTAAARRDAAAAGVDLVGWRDARRLRSVTDILHTHSAFAPKVAAVQAAFAGQVPVVASPRGALAPEVFRRHRPKKTLYFALVERRRLRRVGLFVVLTAGEEADVRRVLGRARPLVRVTGNPITVDSPPDRPGDRAGVVFLGRMDVRHKGLDRLVAVAGQSDQEFRLYGGPPADDAGVELMCSAPANVSVHGPVFGAGKAAVLASAALYAQPSRWEAFGRSIAEAAMLGTPLLLSRECALAAEAEQAGAAVVVDFDRPAEVAAAIEALLAEGGSARRALLGERAAAWARDRFSAEHVARATVEAYAEVLARPDAAARSSTSTRR